MVLNCLLFLFIIYKMLLWLYAQSTLWLFTLRILGFFAELMLGNGRVILNAFLSEESLATWSSGRKLAHHCWETQLLWNFLCNTNVVSLLCSNSNRSGIDQDQNLLVISSQKQNLFSTHLIIFGTWFGRIIILSFWEDTWRRCLNCSKTWYSTSIFSVAKLFKSDFRVNIFIGYLKSLAGKVKCQSKTYI